jgi:hypothetical protein
MKSNRIIVSFAALSLAMAAAAPVFAQRGVGVGLGAGAGSQTNLGIGVGAGAGAGANARTGVGVDAAGTKVGVGSDAGGHATATSPNRQARTADVASAIEANPQLSSRVTGMLPNGTSISSAAAGFQNQGQFLAALHASHNLDIPFSDLKSKMTGSNASSLGSAIQASKPGITKKQANDEAKKAEAEAKASAAFKAKAAAAGSNND